MRSRSQQQDVSVLVPTQIQKVVHAAAQARVQCHHLIQHGVSNVQLSVRRRQRWRRRRLLHTRIKQTIYALCQILHHALQIVQKLFASSAMGIASAIVKHVKATRRGTLSQTRVCKPEKRAAMRGAVSCTVQSRMSALPIAITAAQTMSTQMIACIVVRFLARVYVRARTACIVHRLRNVSAAMDVTHTVPAIARMIMCVGCVRSHRRQRVS